MTQTFVISFIDFHTIYKVFICLVVAIIINNMFMYVLYNTCTRFIVLFVIYVKQN